MGENTCSLLDDAEPYFPLSHRRFKKIALFFYRLSNLASFDVNIMYVSQTLKELTYF